MSDPREDSRAIWDEMAAGWKKFNDYLWDASRPVGEAMIERLDPRPGQKILDIAAGPGDTGFVAAKLVGDEGRLISTDFSVEMVEVARERARQLGVTNVEFKQMDAEAMDLPDDAVDAALCRWGFMLMLDPAAALRETRRVLRPGGRLALATWAGPEANPWVTLVGMAMIQEGFPPQGDPLAPGGIFSLSSPETIRELASTAGFSEVEVVEVPITWAHADFDRAWEFISEVAGPLAALLKTLDEAETARVRAAIESAFDPYRGDDGISVPGVSLVAAAS